MVITVVSFSIDLILLSGFAEILAAIETDNKFCNMEGGSCKLLTFLSFFFFYEFLSLSHFSLFFSLFPFFFPLLLFINLFLLNHSIINLNIHCQRYDSLAKVINGTITVKP